MGRLIKPSDPQIIVWMEIRAPEQPGDQWNDYFQPMIQAPGHEESSWAKMPERLDILLIATIWYSTSAMNEFRDSPSAQLFWESLSAKGITILSSYESTYGNWASSLYMSYIQLFRVYFQAPVTEEQRAHIESVHGITVPALGPSVPRKEYVQSCLPAQVCTTQTENLHGTQVQLMMWPHLWVNAKKAEFRHTETWGNVTLEEKFIGRLKRLDPIEWREEFYRFKRIPYIHT